jgi:prepilin-type N-terminal cleavage/methylation domain-containing protein
MSIRIATRNRGFTLVEVLVSMSVLSLGLALLGTLLVRSARQATAASSVVYENAALTKEIGRLGAMPFAALAAGTTCTTVTAHPMPHQICTTITATNTKRKTIKVKVTPSGNPYLKADSTMFERSISGNVVPPLSTP